MSRAKERYTNKKSLLSKKFTSLNMQVLKPVGLGILSIIMIIGILALTTELVEMEEIAKTVVIPSLILLIGVTAYAMFQTSKYYRSR
jgi:hypothetical protein